MPRPKNRRQDAPKRKKSNSAAKNSAAETNRSRHTERPAKPNFALNSPEIPREPQYTVSQLRAIERLLSGIGTPAPQPFKPDDFQLEALSAIEFEDVLVTAPTGSGKTWIAREEIRRLLESGKRAWYTTPLKALTNSKYQEFSEAFGAENVGILTGDRKINTDAPLIIGTTEIYRNQLFDALRRGEQVNTDFVILDEAHYLADEDRGHVWEEAIILSPPRIRLLLLSATIGNAKEFAEWISEVRGVKVRVVARPGARPVELKAAVLTSDKRIFPLFDEHGKFNPELERQKEDENSNDNSFRRRRHYF